MARAFATIHEYSPRVYHVDLYRLEEPREALALGLDEIFDRDAVVLVEWGDRFPQILPAERIEILWPNRATQASRGMNPALQPQLR
ncbi:MAG: tRNA (adenosine(37)-N6)-threonylcarbamoyltransferase complex ATPase subunit type 1 TsaE [Bryobacterales bacterium]|nr:tRNA (adenosine(37)-N6)-threonylcarbamoyltransferase complex ATPase subunit type 1 TsaE [Bryobacterales bacterium]